MLCGIKIVHYWSAKRKWNSTTEHKKNSFCNSLLENVFPPSHPSHSAASAIQPEITLSESRLRTAARERERKISKKSDCPHTILSGEREEEKNAKPSFRMWICGCLVEGDVITISIRTLFFPFFIIFIFPSTSSFFPCSRGEENCVHFGHSLDIFCVAASCI